MKSLLRKLGDWVNKYDDEHEGNNFYGLWGNHTPTPNGFVDWEVGVYTTMSDWSLGPFFHYDAVTYYYPGTVSFGFRIGPWSFAAIRTKEEKATE